MEEERISYFNLFGFEFPVRHAKLLKYTLLVYLALIVLVVVSIQFFGYKLTNADVPGGAISGFLLAYLISIM